MKPDIYIALVDLKNGIKKHEQFPEGRLSPFVLNDFIDRGKVRKVLEEKELKKEYAALEKIFRPGA